MMSRRKSIRWLGSSFRDLGRLPQKAREEIGDQLRNVQIGLQPVNWKPVKTIGTGVQEIRVRVSRSIFRLVYLAKFSDYICVLHVFQKKSQQTARRDIAIARRRFQALVMERRTEEK